ncbi:NUDIX domain-containing protein [Pseudomonas putida]|uniref:NUDIX domain-containing protein n=1 Tax=Pseudomonas putida TaxID=303 RepID=UPI003D667253
MNNLREMRSTVICLQEGKILLVRKDAPEWSLPGGKIDPGEGHVDAAKRELKGKRPANSPSELQH